MKLLNKISLAILALLLSAILCYAQTDGQNDERSLNEKGMVLGSQGKLKEAKETFEKAQEIQVQRSSVVLWNRQAPLKHLRIIEYVDQEKISPYLAIHYFKAIHKVVWPNVGWEKPIEYYDKIVAQNPGDPGAYFIRGHISYYYGGRISEGDKAISDFSRAIEMNPEFYDAYLMRGMVYYNKLKYDKALPDYNKAIEMNPGQMEYYLQRGRAYDGKKEYDKAISDYNRVIELKNDNVEAYFRRGKSYFFKGEYRNAISDYSRAFEIYPDSFQQWPGRLDFYMPIRLPLRFVDNYNNPEDYEKAISDLEESIGSYKGNAEDFIWLESEAYYWIAFFYKSKLNNLEKALEYFYKVLEVDSLHKATYNELVYTYKNLGDFEKSLWAADRQIEIAPNEANPYDTKGDLYWDHGMIDKAIECYRKALEIRPNFYDSIRKLGNMYIFSGKYNEAKKYYQQLASSPEKDRQAEGRTCLAWIPLYQGKLGEALEILDNAIAADTMESAVDIQTVNKYFIKTLIYEEKKEYTSALKEMRNFMNLLHTMYPGTKKDGRHYYIKLLAENRDFEAAVKISEEFKKDIDNNSRDMPFYWFAKASIEHSKGNFDKSIEYFEQASKLNKNWTSYYLGISYLEGGKIEKSIKEFESLLNDYSRDRLIWGIQSVKSHYYLGRCYEQLGLKEKAIDQYEKFLKIWEKADSGITEIKDATQRLSKLKG